MGRMHTATHPGDPGAPSARRSGPARSRRAVRRLAALALVCALGLLAAACGQGVERVAGSNRIETAVRLSRTLESPDEVVIARSDAHADAIAGAPLAASLDAPILLTPSEHLTATVVAEVTNVAPSSARLLGGTDALAEEVQEALTGAGVERVTRYTGADRFETAAEIASDVPNPQRTAFVVGSQPGRADAGWPDAVAVSALAAHMQAPILLSAPDALPEATASALDSGSVSSVTVVGGRQAVSTGVEDEIADIVDGPVRRVAGADRWETSAEIADLSVAQGMDPARVWLATGTDWPDSLAAAPVAAQEGVLLLIDGQEPSRSSASRAWLQDNAGSIRAFTAVGGTSAISAHALDELGPVID